MTGPPSAHLPCCRCGAPLPLSGLDTSSSLTCPSCALRQEVELFPAFFRRQKAADAGEAVLVEGESSCFFHPHKKAIIPCDSCGRFLCSLCETTIGKAHLCPSCLHTGHVSGKLERLVKGRVLYDQIALSLAILPLLFLPFSLLTAPAAIYVALRYWNAPKSLLPRYSRLRSVAAILIGLAEIGGWAFYLMGHFA